jgi:Fe-S oxidoreductase/nitrate reductase gamma subunit
MLPLFETIIFTFVLIFTIIFFFQPLYLRYKLIKTAQPLNRYDKPLKRIKDAVVSFFCLTCSVKRERIFTGLIHIFLLYGSLTFDTVSLNHVLEGYKEDLNVFGHGTIRSIHTLVVDIFAIMVLVAVLYFIIRRYILRPKNYTYPNLESAIIYTLLITVTLTFLLYQGSVIAHNQDHAYLSFASKKVAVWMKSLIPISKNTVKILWWIHILNVFIFVLYVPRSKYLHMIAGPLNIAFQNYQKTGIIKPIDIENSERFGAANSTDFNWKDLLDSFACIDCGRCDDYCPATQSDKPLSPKNLILKLKQFLLKEKASLLKKEDKPITPLMEDTYTQDEIWTCTSCAACMYVCPVKNEHLPKIIGLRQGQVLMEAKFPPELNQFFKSMETNSNPWGFGSDSRGDWADELNVELLSQDSSVDILYWVGCAGAFDDRSKKVTLSMIKILKEAGINYGILGKEENCCGDQARRLGNEYLFQTIAQENINIFKKYGIRKILTTCPHGYNTFKNEYPEFAGTIGEKDWQVEVIHHSELINDLIQTGRLKINRKLDNPLSFHDPCYLGRHNGIFKAPRSALSHLGCKINEMKNHGYHSSCCGAGGGLMWTDEKLGTRINHMRTDQALETNSNLISTSCPFCLTMLEDGIKDKGKEKDYTIKDLAEIVASCL